MKMSNKAHITVVSSELSCLFLEISICDAMHCRWPNFFNDLTHMQSECVMPYLTQEIRTIKLSSRTKSATVDKVIP